MFEVDQAAEIQLLRAQLNAVAQVALHAVAALEIKEIIYAPRFEAALLQRRWPNSPLDQEIRQAIKGLCNELGSARLNRQAFDKGLAQERRC